MPRRSASLATSGSSVHHSSSGSEFAYLVVASSISDHRDAIHPDRAAAAPPRQRAASSSSSHRPPGHLVTWSPGHLVTWSPGHRVTWPPGHLVTWPPDHLATWAPGHLPTCREHTVVWSAPLLRARHPDQPRALGARVAARPPLFLSLAIISPSPPHHHHRCPASSSRRRRLPAQAAWRGSGRDRARVLRDTNPRRAGKHTRATCQTRRQDNRRGHDDAPDAELEVERARAGDADKVRAEERRGRAPRRERAAAVAARVAQEAREPSAVRAPGRERRAHAGLGCLWDGGGHSGTERGEPGVRALTSP